MTRAIAIGASVAIDVGGNKLTNGADGVAATDFATVGQLSGGGVHTREVIVTNPAVTIADGDSDYLTWDDVQFGDTLLDLTDPTTPVVVTTGIYAVTAYVTSSAALTAGGSFLAQLTLTPTDWPIVAIGTAPASVLPSAVTLSAAWYLQATSTITVQVVNEDGASSRDFFLSAYVQRIA